MTKPVIRGLQCLVLLALFLSMVATVWRIGVMHGDDATWVLSAQRSAFAEAWAWASFQGRLYALAAGTYMLHALRWEGTLYGEVLKYGAFAGFVVMFGAVLRAYWGWRVALLSIGLFLGLHALRFEGSVLVSYPLLVWPAAISTASATLCGRRYVLTGQPGWLLLASFMLLLGLLTNEGLAVTFAALFALSWLANWWLQLDPGPRRGRWYPTKREGRLGVAAVAAVAVYVAGSLIFLQLYPTKYSGHSLSAFDIDRITRVLFSFSTSGSIIHDIFYPYSIPYSVSSVESYRIIYDVGDLVTGSGSFLAYAAFAIMLSTLCWQLLVQKSERSGTESAKLLPEWTAVVPGGVLAFLPILPVALTERYQHWHIDLGILAYATTILSHFGLSIMIAAVLAGLAAVGYRSRVLRFSLATVFACAIGVLSVLAMCMNDRIAWDMRPEGAKWAVFRRAVPLVETAELRASRIVAPQFAAGSWLTAVPEGYWATYASLVLGRPMPVSYSGSNEDDIGRGAVLLSYVMSGDRREFDLIAARLAVGEDNIPLIDRIVVELERPTSSAVAAAVLSYYDREAGAKQVRLGTFPQISADPARFMIDGIKAEPGTVRLSQQAMPGLPNIICGSDNGRGTTLVFGTVMPKGVPRACSAHVFPRTGWWTPEPPGMWTVSDTAVLTLPPSTLAASVSALVFDMTTYTGFGFAQGQQVVRISVDGGPEQSWSFEAGKPIPQVVVPLPVTVTRTDPIKVRLVIEKPIRPSSIGGNTDTRELGAFLRSIRLD